MAACMCWGGWFEKYGIILSVKDGFCIWRLSSLLGSCE